MLEWLKKYKVRILLAVITSAILVAIYFFVRAWYYRRYGIIKDSSNTPQTNMSAARDYRGSGLVIGIENNNPFNIIEDGTPWQGKVAAINRFARFINLPYGIRAGVDSATNRLKANGGTIRAYIAGVPDGKGNLIMGYAPASDGNTPDTYIAYICTALDCTADEDMRGRLDHDTVKKLAWAHMEMENTYAAAHQYITDDDVEAGLSLTPYKS